MTRGMRRFGSVDLELDGLPADPIVLQRATHLLYALAFVMVKGFRMLPERLNRNIFFVSAVVGLIALLALAAGAGVAGLALIRRRLRGGNCRP